MYDGVYLKHVGRRRSVVDRHVDDVTGDDVIVGP